MEYNKVCKNPRCRAEFVSTARNAAYCSSDCQKKHYEAKKVARKAYDETKEHQRLLSATYKVAQRVAEMFLVHNICNECKKEIDDSKLEVHHRDLNPFNNTPYNLVKMCKKCHAQLHLDLPKVNMLTLLEKCGQEEGYRRVYRFMRAVYDNKPRVVVIAEPKDEVNE